MLSAGRKLVEMRARAALRATPKRADEPTFGVDEAIKRLAELSPEARALALTKLSLAHPQPLRG